MLKKGTARIVRIAAALLGILLIAVIVSVLAVSVKYYLLTRNPQGAVVDGNGIFLPDSMPQLGEKRTYQIMIKAPWNADPGTVDVTVPPGLQMVTDPGYTLDRYGWGVTYWRLNVELQPFRTGDLKGGKVGFSFMIPGREAQLFDLKLPALDVKERNMEKTADEIVLSEMVPVPKRLHWMWYVLAVVVLFLLLTGFYFLYRSLKDRKEQILQKSIWEVALDAITELKDALQKQQLIPEEAVAGLTDIVRHFLESYLGIRAERQTTGEFLRELERGGALSEQDRKFLRSFLETADQIKFARAEASVDVFEQTARRAEELVKSCHAASEAEKKLKKGGKKS